MLLNMEPSLLCLCVLTALCTGKEAAEDNERIFTELIRSLEKLHTEAKELIKAQAKAQVSRAEGLLEQLEQEIAELKRKDTELEQLSHTEDHIHFLQVTILQFALLKGITNSVNNLSTVFLSLSVSLARTHFYLCTLEHRPNVHF
jgi:uncharacterized membrane protein (DUF106 family)